MACRYGIDTTWEKSACGASMYPPEYFGQEGSDTYGLKDRSGAQLLKAEGYGEKQQGERELWKISHGYEGRNQEICFGFIHEIPESFVRLVRITRDLKFIGY